jgi:hypothetical protein
MSQESAAHIHAEHGRAEVARPQTVDRQFSVGYRADVVALAGSSPKSVGFKTRTQSCWSV